MFPLFVRLPDDGVPLPVGDEGVVREEDGVVGHRGLAGGQDASGHVADAVQDAVVHQEVVHQQLDRKNQTVARIAMINYLGWWWGWGGFRVSPQTP